MRPAKMRQLRGFASCEGSLYLYLQIYNYFLMIRPNVVPRPS